MCRVFGRIPEERNDEHFQGGARGFKSMNWRSKGGEWGGTIDRRNLFAADIDWVDAPIMRLIMALHTLVDENNRPAIAGFWEDLVPPTEEERAELKKIVENFNEEEMKQWMGIRKFKKGLSGGKLYEGYIMDPWVNLDCIWGGYTGEKVRTILPIEAKAKIDTRIVPNVTLKGFCRSLGDIWTKGDSER